MIVDKILAHLSSKNLTMSESIKYQIEKLAGWTFQRQFMEERQKKGALSFSQAGKCARALAYKLHDFPEEGKEIDSRARLVFWIGDLVELTVISLAKLAGCQITATGFDQVQGKMKVMETVITGYPDGILLQPEHAIVEVKSMAGYTHDRFCKGDIDAAYIAQIQINMWAFNMGQAVVVAVNKENGMLAEQIVQFDPKAMEAITKRFVSVLQSTKESLPEPEYKENEKGELPWQCRYCAYFKTCRPEYDLIVKSGRYILKKKKEA